MFDFNLFSFLVGIVLGILINRDHVRRKEKYIERESGKMMNIAVTADDIPEGYMGEIVDLIVATSPGEVSFTVDWNPTEDEIPGNVKDHLDEHIAMIEAEEVE